MGKSEPTILDFKWPHVYEDSWISETAIFHNDIARFSLKFNGGTNMVAFEPHIWMGG
ncbi:unnamed protein product, partial [Mycena citricolor]